MADIKKLYRVLICGVAVAGCAGEPDGATSEQGVSPAAQTEQRTEPGDSAADAGELSAPDAGEPDAGGTAICPW